MIESLLRKNSFILLCLFISVLYSCSNSAKKNNYKKEPIVESDLVLKKKQDTIFFKNNEEGALEVVTKEQAHFFRVLTDSTSKGYKFIDYSMYKYSSGDYEPKRAGCILNPYELSAEKALANGKWIVFGNDSSINDLSYHMIGYYKNGVKDSIFYTNYEDGWNEYFYYKNGKCIDYIGEVKFYGYRGSLIVEGSKFIKSGLPIGKWKYYHINNEILEYDYIHQKDSIMVKYTNYDKNTNKIIDKGTFVAAKYADEFEYREIEK